MHFSEAALVQAAVGLCPPFRQVTIAKVREVRAMRSVVGRRRRCIFKKAKI